MNEMMRSSGSVQDRTRCAAKLGRPDVLRLSGYLPDSGGARSAG